jgi:MFS family permease
MSALAAAVTRTFRSLRVYNYRLFFFSQVVSMSGTWMQSIAQAWLIVQLTGSSIDLGVTVAMQFGPVLLLGAWAGVLADRLDKRRFMMATQTAAAVCALVLGLLTVGGVVEVWMVWLLAALTGVAVALDMPARQSFVAEMVERDDIANAVGLNSVIINSSRIIGPAIGGVLLAANVDVGVLFLLNAASFAGVIAALAVMRTGELHGCERVRRERGQLRAGLRYVWRTSSLRTPLLMMAVISTLGYNFSVLLPLLARYAYGGGGGSLGALTAAMGIGALAGALLMAWRRRPGPRLLVLAATAFGLFSLGVAAAPGFVVALVLLVPMGAATVLFISTTNSLLQLNAKGAMRGRVMALWSVVFLGSTPIGGPLTGWLADAFGPRWATAIGALATLAAAAVAAVAVAGRRGAGGGAAPPAPPAGAPLADPAATPAGRDPGDTGEDLAESKPSPPGA